ncbi:ubiquitin protein ligase [Aureococcus anophagefferens]|nr:ubiquitin protein ligase [Aureococcus anophagefferens]
MARLLVAAAALAAAAAAPPPRLRGAQRAIAQTIPHTRHWLAGAAGDDPAADDAAADDDDPSFVQGYFFVIVIALVLFCGCTCLSVSEAEGARVEPDHRRRAGRRVGARVVGGAAAAGRRGGGVLRVLRRARRRRARRRPNGSLFEPREPRGAAAVDDEDLEYVASRPFREKQLWFERALDGLHGTDPRRPRSRSYRPVTLDVRRGACLFDSLKRFEQLSVDRLRNASVRVRFAGEAGIDAGGVRRERVTIPATLSLPLLKHVLGVPLSFSDLEFVDAEAFLNYAWLRDNGGAEDLCLDFTIFADGDDEGAPKTPVELVPNGGDVPVTDDNKAEFLALVLKYKVLDAVAPQLAAFLQGFDDILPRTYLSVFDYQELSCCWAASTRSTSTTGGGTRYLGAF